MGCGYDLRCSVLADSDKGNHDVGQSVSRSVGQSVSTMSGVVRVRTTNGHEAEAKAAQMKKKPSRIGTFVLKVLGHQSGQRK
jgi:hypothetical protein